MKGPAGVMALILAETAAGGVGFLFLTPLWNEVRRGFFSMPVERWLLERIEPVRLRLGYTRSEYVKRALHEALLGDQRLLGPSAKSEGREPLVNAAARQTP